MHSLALALALAVAADRPQGAGFNDGDLDFFLSESGELSAWSASSP